jgi:membrane protease YdiL (CAAX protease family)
MSNLCSASSLLRLLRDVTEAAATVICTRSLQRRFTDGMALSGRGTGNTFDGGTVRVLEVAKMSTGATGSTQVISLPLWQAMLVLVGLPAVYLANSLLPWSTGLLQRHDHAFFLQFWTSIAVLHWSSVALVLVLLKRAGRRLADIGLDLSPLRIAVAVGIPVVVGVSLTVLIEMSGANPGPPSDPSAVVAPATFGERLLWIFMSVTAGFCEELIYRGFGIRALQGRNVRTWLAVGLAALAFVLMHGINVIAPVPFLTIYIAGVLFGALFLWRRSLLPGICLHALIDMLSIGTP